MIYIKYKDYKGGDLEENECLLMSRDEFMSGGKNIIGIPITITPDGSEPQEDKNYDK